MNLHRIIKNICNFLFGRKQRFVPIGGNISLSPKKISISKFAAEFLKIEKCNIRFRGQNDHFYFQIKQKTNN